MKFTLAIFAEYSPQIGTGHLIESINLLKLALAERFKVTMWVSDTLPTSILEKFPYSYNSFHSFSSQSEIIGIRNVLIRDGYKVVLFNLRKISNEIISLFKYNNLKLICIDELGNRNLDCDVIINPTIIKKYYNYTSSNKRLKVYIGPIYLSISPEFAKIHLQKRVFNKEIKAVLVCMGGVDRTGTTLKIIDALAEWKPEVRKNIILGGGFLYLDDVSKRIELLKDMNFKAYHKITNIESFMSESDVAFTAGGNSLYELACVGTPAIVLYEDEHERENGIAFEHHGFGYCLGRGVDVRKKDILSAIKKFEDVKVRSSHSSKGKEIVDGKGSFRTLNIIKKIANYDSTVKTIY